MEIGFHNQEQSSHPLLPLTTSIQGIIIGQKTLLIKDSASRYCSQIVMERREKPQTNNTLANTSVVG